MSHARTIRFETVGEPAVLTEKNLLGRILELHDRPCQARKRDGRVCGIPSKSWQAGIGVRCRRHTEAHWCRVCAA